MTIQSLHVEKCLWVVICRIVFHSVGYSDFLGFSFPVCTRGDNSPTLRDWGEDGMDPNLYPSAQN